MNSDTNGKKKKRRIKTRFCWWPNMLLTLPTYVSTRRTYHCRSFVSLFISPFFICIITEATAIHFYVDGYCITCIVLVHDSIFSTLSFLPKKKRCNLCRHLVCLVCVRFMVLWIIFAQSWQNLSSLYCFAHCLFWWEYLLSLLVELWLLWEVSSKTCCVYMYLRWDMCQGGNVGRKIWFVYSIIKLSVQVTFSTALFEVLKMWELNLITNVHTAEFLNDHWILLFSS